MPATIVMSADMPSHRTQSRNKASLNFLPKKAARIRNPADLEKKVLAKYFRNIHKANYFFLI